MLQDLTLHRLGVDFFLGFVFLLDATGPPSRCIMLAYSLKKFMFPGYEEFCWWEKP